MKFPSWFEFKENTKEFEKNKVTEIDEIKSGDYNAWYNRGIFLSKLGNYDEAVKSYDRAVEIKPDDYLSWAGRGKSFGKLEKFGKAIESYDKAIEIKPDYYVAKDNQEIVRKKLTKSQ